MYGKAFLMLRIIDSLMLNIAVDSLVAAVRFGIFTPMLCHTQGTEVVLRKIRGQAGVPAVSGSYGWSLKAAAARVATVVQIAISGLWKLSFGNRTLRCELQNSQP